MWTWHRDTWRGWDLDNFLRHQWCKRQASLGGNPVNDIFFTPQGWLLVSYWSYYNDDRSYALFLIENERLVADYTLTFDEFEEFPLMPGGFWVPF